MRLLVAILCLSSVAAAAEPPAPLKCLQRWYAVTPVQVDGHWFAALPDGTRVPYDDGRAKTFHQRLDDPDIKDMFLIRYERRGVAPVTSVDDDPGRVRVEAMFRATYNASELQTIELFGQRLRVHRKVVEAFHQVERALVVDASLKPYLTGFGGTYVVRNIAGTQRASAHSYGISVDLNPRLGDYWRWSKTPHWRNRIPRPIVDAFEAAGFIWGGRWYHYDTMHFEYRPELLDPSCYAP